MLGRGIDPRVANATNLCQTSLNSGTIEWAVNLEIVDMLSNAPYLHEVVLTEIHHRLVCTAVVRVQLALSLLEMMVKNLGFETLRRLSEDILDDLVALVKKRDTWQYSFERNLYKSVGSAMRRVAGSTAPQLGISSAERAHWQRVRLKVLAMLQLWTDAFLLRQGELRPLFDAYKALREEGVTFPPREATPEEAPALLGPGDPTPSARPPPPRQAAGGPPDRQRAPAEQQPQPDAARASPERQPEPAGRPLPPMDSADVERVKAELEALVTLLDGVDAAGLLAGRAEGESTDLQSAALRQRLDKCERLMPKLRELIEYTSEEPAVDAEGGSGALDEMILCGLLELFSGMEAAVARGHRCLSHEVFGASQLSTVNAGPSTEAIGPARAHGAEDADMLNVFGDPPAASAAPAAAPSLPEQDLLGFGDSEPVAPSGSQCVAASAAVSGDAPALGPMPPLPPEREPTAAELEAFDLILAQYLQEEEWKLMRQMQEAEDERVARELQAAMDEEQGHQQRAQAQMMARLAAAQEAHFQRFAPPARGPGPSLGGPSQGPPELLTGFSGSLGTSSRPGKKGRANAEMVGFGSAPPPPEEVHGGGTSHKGLGYGMLANTEQGESLLGDGAAKARGGTGASTLVDGASAYLGEALRGAAHAAAGAVSSGGSGGAVRSLGAGVPSSYAAVDAEGSSLLGGGGVSAPSSHDRLRSLRKFVVKHGGRSSKAGLSDQKARLLSEEDAEVGDDGFRSVQVEGGWELVRRPGQGEMPFWYHAGTGRSQWEPPECVRSKARGVDAGTSAGFSSFHA